MAADFQVFYDGLGQTSIYQTFIQDSTSVDAVSWLVNAVSGIDRYPTDFTTLHDYWNAIREELDGTVVVNEAIALELKSIASTAEMEFTFDDDGYVTYL
jgi:hypothetical protein